MMELDDFSLLRFFKKMFNYNLRGNMDIQGYW